MKVTVSESSLRRIAYGLELPTFLPAGVVRDLQAYVVWMEASMTLADVMTLAEDDHSFLLAEGYRLEFRVESDGIVVSGVLSPVEKR